jgi:hypothetical protein
MEGPEFNQDNQWLATEILRLVPKGSAATQFVDTARNDGRGMFLILKRDCIGNNWQNLRSFEVRASICDLSWNGKNSGNSFETCIANMLKIHKEALLLGDPIKEWDKCRYLIDGIKSEMFDRFKDNIGAEQDSFNSFTELYSRAKQVKIQKDDETKGRKRKTDHTATNRHGDLVKWNAKKRMDNPIFAKLYPEQKAHFRKIRAEYLVAHPEEKDKDKKEKNKKGNDTRNASSLVTSPGKVFLDDVSDSEVSCEPPPKAKPYNQGVVEMDYGNAAGIFGVSAYANNECSLFGDDSSIEDNKVDCRYISAVEVDSKPAIDWKATAEGMPVEEFLKIFCTAITGEKTKVVEPPEPPEAVVMDESKPRVTYPQSGLGHPIIDQFGCKGQHHRNGMNRMTNKEVLEWASESTLRWAKQAYSELYPEWLKTKIISDDVDANWKTYEYRTSQYPDDRIAELIRFRNHYDRPMYKSEFQHTLKVDRKKIGYDMGEWQGSNYLRAYHVAWQQVNGDPTKHKVEFDRDFTSSEWFLD